LVFQSVNNEILDRQQHVDQLRAMIEESARINRQRQNTIETIIANLVDMQQHAGTVVDKRSNINFYGMRGKR